MSRFNIREDLEFRPLKQQIEILWISGPTWHNAKMIADRLQIDLMVVCKTIDEIRRKK